MRGSLLGLVLAMSGPQLVLAGTEKQENHQYTKQFDVCMNKSGGVTSHMRECILEETDRQDALLQSTLNRIEAKSPPLQRSKIRKSHEARIKLSEKKCRKNYDRDVDVNGEGSLYLVEYNSCMLQTKIDSIAKLKERK